MPQFKNSPIVEAIFEVKFPAELSIECNKDKYYEIIRKEFPQILIPKTFPTDAYALEPFQFINNEKNKIIRFSINQFAFITTKYDNFQSFQKECLKYMGTFFELYKITNIKKTGFRCINHIPVSIEGESITLEKYLNLGYTFTCKYNLFSLEFISEVREGKLKTLIQWGGVQNNFILLDFDYFLEKGLLAGKISEYLEKSNQCVEEAFLRLVTNDFKENMEGV